MGAVWPVKSRQMSIKVAQKWFHYKNERFWHIYKNCLKHGWFGQNNFCHWLWKVAQSAINRPIWLHCMGGIVWNDSKDKEDSIARIWILASSFGSKRQRVSENNNQNWVQEKWQAIHIYIFQSLEYATSLRLKVLHYMSSGCGSVSRVVASNSRGPQFKSSHQLIPVQDTGQELF